MRGAGGGRMAAAVAHGRAALAAAGLVAVLVMVAWLATRPAWGEVAVPTTPTSPALLLDCRTAIAEAARTHGVAENVLLAIGTVESGLSPWAINANGQPRVYDSREAAIAGTGALRAAGIDSIDVGCMQINLHWHPDAFADLAEAFDPRANADYAARFLLALYRQTGSWPAAMASYHSSEPSSGARYGCQVQAQLARLQGEAPPPCAATLDIGPAPVTLLSTRVHGVAALGPRSRVVRGAELRVAAGEPGTVPAGVGGASSASASGATPLAAPILAAPALAAPGPAARSRAASVAPATDRHVAVARSGRDRVVRGRGLAVEPPEAQTAVAPPGRTASRVLGGRR